MSLSCPHLRTLTLRGTEAGGEVTGSLHWKSHLTQTPVCLYDIYISSGLPRKAFWDGAQENMSLYLGSWEEVTSALT